MPVELDDEPALTLSALREARIPVVAFGEGRLNVFVSSPDADSPNRWGKVAVASDPWTDICADACLVSIARLFRSMAPKKLIFQWGFNLTDTEKVSNPRFRPASLTYYED